MIIDTHVHFWDPSRKDDILLLRREPSMVKRFYPDDLKPLLMSIKANRCIVIQSAPHPSETDNLIEITKDLDWIHGIVGWADLEASNISEILCQMKSKGPIVGVRVMLHRLKDNEWINRPSVEKGLSALIDADLSLDLITETRHITAVRKALIKFPNLRAIINHGATPPIAADEFEPWASELKKLSNQTTAWCKFSGLLEVSGKNNTESHILPYAKHLFQTFGPNRLLFASNWPACNLAGGYVNWWNSALSIFDILKVNSEDVKGIIGGNALKAYPNKLKKF